MFRHSAASPSSAPSYSDALMHHQHAAAGFPAALSVTVPAQIPRGAAAGYLDGNVGAFSSPPSSCYSSSLPAASSYYNSIQRSISSHLLLRHIQFANDRAFGGGSNGFLWLSSRPPRPSTAVVEVAKKKGGAEAADMCRAVSA